MTDDGEAAAEIEFKSPAGRQESEKSTNAMTGHFVRAKKINHAVQNEKVVLSHENASKVLKESEMTRGLKRICSRLSAEVSGILEFGNVWVFVQLIFGPHWPMNQLNKNPNIA